jgi:probable HAF family extracellular repeat protein
MPRAEHQTASVHRRFVAVAWLMAATIAITGCGGGGGGGSPTVDRAQFSSLGFPSGYESSEASAVSADGSVVVGTATAAIGDRQAFRWTASQGISGLGVLPGGAHTMASGVSADGSIVVGNGDTSSEPPTPVAGFRWLAERGISRIAPIPGSYLCDATGVSGDGATIVGTCLTVNNEAFRWTEATGSYGLGRFGGGSDQSSSAAAISAEGTVIVGAGHPVITGALMWQIPGTAIALGKLPGDASATALAVSRDGAVVVGMSINDAQASRAFRWTRSSGMIALETGIDMQDSLAAAVSGDGSRIVGWAMMSSRETAVIWDAEHGLRPLDAVLASEYQTRIAGWQLTRATAISDDGRTVAGVGTNAQGAIEAWIIKLPN